MKRKIKTIYGIFTVETEILGKEYWNDAGKEYVGNFPKELVEKYTVEFGYVSENKKWLKAYLSDSTYHLHFEIIKDNPVPSLNNKEIKLIVEALCAYGDDEEIIDLCEKLENGVTTDKEQPKCSACGTHTTRKKQGTNIYVCIDCSH